MKLIGIMILGMLLVMTSVVAEQGDGQGLDGTAGANADGVQPVLYGNQGGDGNGTGGSNGTGTGDGIGDGDQGAEGLGQGDKVQTIDQLKEQIQERQQTMAKEMEGMDEDMQKMYQNQNQVRNAVQTMLQMENMMGGIGPQVSEVAKKFNNSLNKTLQAEEKIQTRSGFTRFFAGGDKESGKALEQEAIQNQERIQELKQLKEQCSCDEAVKTMLQEQIQNMEQEQTRLKELGEKEQKSKGMFGWLWK